MLTETNYRVWSTMTEQMLKEKKLWAHITRTARLPAPVRVLRAAIIGAPAEAGSDEVIGIPAVTKAMVDLDIKMHEDFDAAAARANYVVMQTLSQKDISAVMMLQDVAEKWDKLADDYASVSDSFATLARTRFHSFKILNGESVTETQHRFDDPINECNIQGVNLTEGDKTAALLMRPSAKWLNFFDAYGTMEPLPSVRTIFRAMKAQEERMNSRNESEYEEANFAGNSGGRVRGADEWKRRQKLDIKRPDYGPETRNCYCCGQSGHLAKDCSSKLKTCEICEKRGHLAVVCRSKPSSDTSKEEGETEEVAPNQDRSTKLLWPQKKPNLSFATKKEKARTEEGMFFSEVPNISTRGFRVTEGAGQNWGGRRDRGTDKVILMATEKKVGIPTQKTTIGELSTERAGVRINRGGEKIMTHSASSRGSSMETSFYLDDLIFSDADDGTISEDYITAK